MTTHQRDTGHRSDDAIKLSDRLLSFLRVESIETFKSDYFVPADSA